MLYNLKTNETNKFCKIELMFLDFYWQTETSEKKKRKRILIENFYKAS